MKFKATLAAVSFGLAVMGGNAAAQDVSDDVQDAAEQKTFDLSESEMQTLRERQYINDCIRQEGDVFKAYKEMVAAEREDLINDMATKVVEDTYVPTVRQHVDEGRLTQLQGVMLVEKRIEQEAEKIAADLDAIEAGQKKPKLDTVQDFCIAHGMVEKGINIYTLGQRWSAIGDRHGFDALSAPVKDPWKYERNPGEGPRLY